MPLDPVFWKEIFRRVVSDIMAWLPILAGAIALLLIGWVVARLTQAFLGGLLRRLGVDRLAERAGAIEVLARSGLKPSAAYLISRVVYWLVLLLFIFAAAESLKLRGVADIFGGFLNFLPRLLAAAVIMLIGGLIARVVGEAVSALAVQSGISTGLALGQVVRYVLLIFVIILVLEQIGVRTTLLTTATIALIASISVALSISFGWGSRGLARNIMAGFHAKEEFKIGQTVTVQGHTGKLTNIGAVKIMLDTSNGRVSLPNSVLTEEEVIITSDPDEPVESSEINPS